jgi:hypothetical protein
MMRPTGGPTAWRWVLLFLIQFQAGTAQVVVVNGLGHFHPWNRSAVGSIVLMNPTGDSLRVLIQTDSLWGPQHSIRLASEVLMPPQSRRSVPYEWLGTDSSSQGLRILLSTVAERIDPGTSGEIRVLISTRYAVDLYRGRIADDLDVQWTPDGIRVHNLGVDFWAGSCYPLHGQSRGTPRLASGVLRPGDVRIWPVPEDADGIWLERVDGYIVASPKP